LALSDTTDRGIIYTDENIRLGWELCWSCESHRPNRAYHCPECRACALRRDHHCNFAVNCVGFTNARYFYTFLIWLTIGSLYVNIINLDFLVRLAAKTSIKSLISFFVPLVAWALGIVDEDFYDATLSMISLFVLAISIFYLKVHIDVVKEGRTRHEIDINEGTNYQKPLVPNLEEIFGKNWKLAWISPFIPSQLQGDGTHYIPNLS